MEEKIAASITELVKAVAIKVFHERHIEAHSPPPKQTSVDNDKYAKDFVQHKASIRDSCDWLEWEDGQLKQEVEDMIAFIAYKHSRSASSITERIKHIKGI